jgi:hypothetical protein
MPITIPVQNHRISPLAGRTTGGVAVSADALPADADARRPGETLADYQARRKLRQHGGGR